MNSKFVVIGTQRSGTTMLINSLNSLDGITCYGEILSKNISKGKIEHWQPEMLKQRKLKNENCFGAWLKKNPQGTLHEFLDDIFSRNSYVGFKMLYEHYEKDKDILDEYFKNRPEIRFILINRLDKIKQAISHKLKKKDKFREKIYVDPTWIRKLANELDAKTKILRKRFFYNYIEITYEEMTFDNEITELGKNVSRKILEFIEYENSSINIPVNTKKHWPSKIKDRVINYRDIKNV